MTILLFYVDDMIITGNDENGIKHLKNLLNATFKMKDLGRLTYFLGWEVEYWQDGIMLSQRKYAEDLVTQACLSDQKVAHTPMEINVKYKNDDGDPLAEPTLYRRLIGCLIYLTMTRPGISYPVQVLSKFVANPCQCHFSALLRIIRYVRSTINRGLFFHSTSSLNLKGYADADWAGCPNSQKSNILL
ncbi:uncharacterized mitochondrial protein AtMg00810-like [Lycium barbarum]|uniref:uncharacterized mitochondrial protein AtMg00810-like n=1 Tax=Lycium barbarum TaxID=112863 RepID=UPI00293F40CE|nr:uncharacterized mitochondrial protein AtMg00810-like [Lycium barbarum]